MVFELLVPLIFAFTSIPLDAQVLGRAQHVPTLSAPIIITTPCSSSRAVFEPKGSTRQSSLDTIPHDCNYSYNLGVSYVYYSPSQPALGYDTLTSFVERCPTNSNAPSAFGALSTAVQKGGNGPSPECWISFRQWLLSALAWNPRNAAYFCADVHSIIGTFGSPYDTSWTQVNTATNKSLAVLQYLLRNPLCWNSDDSELYVGSRGSQRRAWIDTQDTSKVPLDTTLPSMHDLGLDSVLKYAALLGFGEASGVPSIITAAFASPNPTGEGTSINFTTSREAYVKIDVLDLLGKQVATNGFGSVVEPGRHSVPISLHELPSGTYYARIQTTYGEVQTVKIVKE